MTQRSPADFWNSSIIANDEEPKRHDWSCVYMQMLPNFDLDGVGYDCGGSLSSNFQHHVSQTPGSDFVVGYSSNFDANSLPTWSSIQMFHSPLGNDESALLPIDAEHEQLCRVCNDICTGKHFGVLSCEACKGFFRRSIRAAARYVCKHNKCCEIDMDTRKKCQHCRLQKCFDVGMNKNAVREERGAKECKSSSRRIKSIDSVQQSPRNISNPGMPFSFDTFTPFHIVNTSLNFDTKSQEKSAVSSTLEALAKADMAENSIVPLTPSLPDGVIPENIRWSFLSVISWAKEIPMFAQLPIEDQIELIKTTWSEVNTLKLVYRVATCPYRGGINFQTDDLAHFYLTDSQVVASCIKEAIKECVTSMENIQLDKSELSYLKLITLMNPFIHNLTASGQKEIELAQDVGLELLEAYIKQTNPDSTQRMTKLLLFLNRVRVSSKDIIAHIEDQQTIRPNDDAVLLALIS